MGLFLLFRSAFPSCTKTRTVGFEAALWLTTLMSSIMVGTRDGIQEPCRLFTGCVSQPHFCRPLQCKYKREFVLACMCLCMFVHEYTYIVCACINVWMCVCVCVSTSAHSHDAIHPHHTASSLEWHHDSLDVHGNNISLAQSDGTWKNSMSHRFSDLFPPLDPTLNEGVFRGTICLVVHFKVSETDPSGSKCLPSAGSFAHTLACVWLCLFIPCIFWMGETSSDSPHPVESTRLAHQHWTVESK